MMWCRNMHGGQGYLGGDMRFPTAFMSLDVPRTWYLRSLDAVLESWFVQPLESSSSLSTLGGRSNVCLHIFGLQLCCISM